MQIQTLVKFVATLNHKQAKKVVIDTILYRHFPLFFRTIEYSLDNNPCLLRKLSEVAIVDMPINLNFT